MERKYAQIQPAPENRSGASSEASPQVPEIKRRRLGVSVACNSCRRKKIRCDGQRPACTNCIGSTTKCSYRDESDLSHESRKIVLEVIRTLNIIPAPEATRILQMLSTETNAPIILSTLRDEAAAAKATSDPPDTTATGQDKPVALEFEVQNPIAYPVIARSDRIRLEKSLPNGPPSRPTSSGRASASQTISKDGYLSSAEPTCDIARNLSDVSPSTMAIEQSDSDQKAAPVRLCDNRLHGLDIQYWTDVNISNDTAAKCISLYLETDHPLLANFDAELFVSDLVSQRNVYCSSLLVNALLYWACQMYSSVDKTMNDIVMSFCVEAEKLWVIEQKHNRDTVINIAAVEFLCLGYLGQGRDHAILTYVAEASLMGQRMGLFGIENQDNLATIGAMAQTADEPTRARMYAAWGVFNWITLMSLFYRQPGISCPKHPPSIAIPKCTQHPAEQYMGTTFPQICRFWLILHELSLVYSEESTDDWGSRATFSFSEFKFRELLAWSNNLPSRLTLTHKHPHHVQILHLWFHAAILDIFRPCIKKSRGDIPLRTFSSAHTTPNAVCAASITQLKHLISDYRLNYSSSAYTILWHTALLYVINAILTGERVQNWYSDLLLCIYAYESLGRSWRVAAGIGKGLLSLTMQKTSMPSGTARRILDDLHTSDLDPVLGEIRATFMADLELAQSDPSLATVEHLARHFEENVLLRELTTFFEDI